MVNFSENSTPAFLEFLDMLGQRVRLKGFDGYRGGHDTRGDTTGGINGVQFKFLELFQEHTPFTQHTNNTRSCST